MSMYGKKPVQYCKVISLQLIKINGKKTTTLFLVYFVKLPLSCLHGKAQKLLNFVAFESRFVWRRSEIVLPCKGALWKSGGGCFWFLIQSCLNIRVLLYRSSCLFSLTSKLGHYLEIFKSYVSRYNVIFFEFHFIIKT